MIRDIAVPGPGLGLPADSGGGSQPTGQIMMGPGLRLCVLKSRVTVTVTGACQSPVPVISPQPPAKRAPLRCRAARSYHAGIVETRLLTRTAAGQVGSGHEGLGWAAE